MYLCHVVESKATTLSFVEVVNIKIYYDKCITICVCESSTTSDLKIVELVILAAKLNIYTCDSSMDFGVTWFAKQ